MSHQKSILSAKETPTYVTTAIQDSPVKNPRRARGIATRKVILQSAITSIASKGLSNTTLDSVAEFAGVSRTLAIFHFKSKKQLYIEVLEHLGKEFAEGWHALEIKTFESTMQKLIVYLDYDIRFAYQHPKYVSAWHAFWGESQGNMLYRELALPRDDRYDSELKSLLTTLIETEGIDKEDLQAICDALGAMTYGFWLGNHLDPSPDNYERAMASVRLFLRNTFPKLGLPVSD